MNYVETKNKEWCEEKISEIKTYSPENLFIIETQYDIRLCGKSDLGIETHFVCHSYISLYGFLKGMITAFQMEKFCTTCP